MDLLSLLRTLGGLGVVLGLLAGALWGVRRFDIRLPGRVGGASARRLDVVERLTLDAKRSVALIRRDGVEHLVLLEASGAVVIEAGISARTATAGPQEPTGIAKPTSFAPAADAVGTVAAASPHDDSATSFQEALSRIQERARRLRTSAATEHADA
jgi:flagellar protein FliO/FliZ